MDTSSSTFVKEIPAGGVIPADCGCGGAPASDALVYVMGAPGFDFGSYARRDAFQAVNNGMPLVANSDLSSYLVVTPVDSASVVWTLSIDNTPVYAIQPVGSFARATYRQLQAYLVDPNIDRIFVPGRIAGSTTLLNGQVLPVVQPEPQGIKPWSSAAMGGATAQLTGALALAPSSVYLTGEGSLDWSHFGFSAASNMNRKLSAALPGALIGNGQIAMLVTGPAAISKGGYGSTFSWTDGAPTLNFIPAPGLTPGYLSVGAGSTFNLTVPASTTPRVLRLYVRTGNGPSKLTASLSNTSLTYTDDTLVSLAQGGATVVDGVYALAYRATEENQTLSVTWQSSGAVETGLQAASLQIGALSPSSGLKMYGDRLQFDLRNMGVSPQERAVNFAAAYAGTSKPATGSIFAAMFKDGKLPEDITVERNTRCRPEADCWDVVFRFFDPRHNTERSRRAFRITVDVSLVKPLIVGQVQSWNEF